MLFTEMASIKARHCRLTGNQTTKQYDAYSDEEPQKKSFIETAIVDDTVVSKNEGHVL